MLSGLPLALLLSQTPAGLEPAAFEVDLATLAEGVRERWSYYEDRSEHAGLELDALIDRTRAAARRHETLSPTVVDRLLRELVSDLQDGHAGVEVPGVELPSRRWSFALTEVEEGYAIAALVESGAREVAVGELVLEVDGLPIEEAVAEAERLAFGSTPGMRRRNALERLTHTERPTVAIRLAGSPSRTVALPTLPADDPRLEPEPEPWSLSAPREGVALLRIASFKLPGWRRWLAASQEERDVMVQESYRRLETLFAELDASGARAMILDLRGNAGGTDSLGIHVAKHLLEGEFRYFLLSVKADGAWREPAGLAYSTDEGMRPFRGPVVALIDADCFSTTDNLLRCLHDLHPRFTAVGRPTGAGTGAPRVIAELPRSRARVTLCTMRVYGPAGRLTEGRGTLPDVPVAWTGADLAAGRDPDLAAALRLLEDH